MEKIPVIIDSDPGTDDVAALLLAYKSERFDVKAITAVAGNVELKDTADNALRLASYIGWDVAVAKGADKPLLCPLQTAEDIHGKGGMRGLTLPDPCRGFDSRPAWDLIYDVAKECGGRLEIIAIGPLTNIATALMKYPELKSLIKRIVIMGGAILAGNTTPAAEFNIYVDPEAAKRVFESGVPVYMCPLDVTHQSYITKEEIAGIAKLGTKEAEFFAEITGRDADRMSFYSGGRGVPLHDPCAVLFAEDESYFEYEECFIGVETSGDFARGKTVTDCYSDKQLENNAFLVKSVDRDAFISRIFELMRRYQ